MNPETGGDGYGKIKKSFQTGGASGWAKHCGDTEDHKMSNRAERRAAKQSLKSTGGGNHVKKKRVKPPTRKHMLDKLMHVDKQIAVRKKQIEDHRKKVSNCKCYIFCSDRWLDEYYGESRDKIIADFRKFGYELP